MSTPRLAAPPLLAHRLEAVLTVDGPAAGRHEWYLRQLPAVAADHVVHDAARLVRCRALRRAERLSHHWHPARLEGNAPLLPEFPAAERFAAGGAIPSARGLRVSTEDSRNVALSRATVRKRAGQWILVP